MAICNILGEMRNSTGNFLTFSQYIEDLTRWQVDPTYKIVPSKFIALNIKSFKRNIIKGYLHNQKDDFDYNKWIPEIFTNYLENRCAWLKTKDVEGKWTPYDFKNLFWEVMTTTQEHVVSTNNTDSGSPIIDKSDIMYIGDIEVNSYDNVNGQGYSEIYCYIPNSAKRTNYNILKNDSDSSGLNVSPDTVYKDSQFVGCTNETDRTDYNMLYKIPDNYYIEDTNSNTNDDKFDVNAIVVLYDVVDNGNEYQDIPMGIYFTGLIDSESGQVQNFITKYVINNDVYDSGTSYGLRICSRYATTQRSNNISIAGNNNADLSKVLSKISQTCDKMNEVLDKFNSNNNVNKSLIDLLKKSQTNVPYVQKVNGVEYWFVNGKKITTVSK